MCPGLNITLKYSQLHALTCSVICHLGVRSEKSGRKFC